MTEPTLTCPSCRTEIKLDRVFGGAAESPIPGKWYETKLAQKRQRSSAREAGHP